MSGRLSVSGTYYAQHTSLLRLLPDWQEYKKESAFMLGMEQNVCNVNRKCVTDDESVNNVPGCWFVMLCKHFFRV